MKTNIEIRGSLKKYSEDYLLSSDFEGDIIFTQAYEIGLAPISSGGYFLADMGMSHEDVLLQAADIEDIDELPEIENFRESSIVEYWIHQLAGYFYISACEMADEKFGVGNWTEETTPEFGGWEHIILVANPKSE